MILPKKENKIVSKLEAMIKSDLLEHTIIIKGEYAKPDENYISVDDVVKYLVDKRIKR